MDRELSKTLYEVENPVYMTFDDMKKKYLDKMVIITNKEGSAREGTKGGIVRYYGRASDDFYKKWDECVSVDEYEPVLLCSFSNITLLCGYPIGCYPTSYN